MHGGSSLLFVAEDESSGKELVSMGEEITSGEAFSEQLSCRILLIPLLWPQLPLSGRSHGRLMMSMELGFCAAQKGFWICTAIIQLTNI